MLLVSFLILIFILILLICPLLLVLGDVERLSNGNTLVTFSRAGTIHEVDSTGKLVMSIQANSLGYADFRPSLYGPPPR